MGIMNSRQSKNQDGEDREKTGAQGFLAARYKTKFTSYGREIIQKKVKQSGNSGRVYLPPEWVGKIVKVIRVD